jgi:hypothetical protein
LFGKFVAAVRFEVGMPKTAKKKSSTARRAHRKIKANEPIPEYVLNSVIDRLSRADLERVYRKSLLGLIEIGDTSLSLDFEMMAGFGKGDDDGNEPGPLTRTKAIDIVVGLESWLAQLERACDEAWALSGSKNAGHYRLPLRALRSILRDLAQNNQTIWTKLNPRKQGQSDDAYSTAVKDRVALAIRFLTKHGWGRPEVHAAALGFIGQQADLFGRRTLLTLAALENIRVRAGLTLAPDLNLRALTLLEAHEKGRHRAAHSTDDISREKLLGEVIALLLSEPVRQFFAAPRDPDSKK